MKLVNLCLRKLIKISTSLSRDEWVLIAKFADWSEFEASDLYDTRLVSPLATSCHFFAAYAKKLNWNPVLEQLQYTLVSGMARGHLSKLDACLIARVLEAGGDYVDWARVSRMYAIHLLEADFFSKNKHRLDWKGISLASACSETFIENHKSHVDWPTISMHKSFSVQFLVKFKDYICWDKYLELNRVVSAQVLLASAQYVSLDFLASKQVLPEQVISKLVQYTKQQIEICESYNMLEEQWYIFKHQLIRFWTFVCKNSAQSMSTEFIRHHKAHIDWYALSSSVRPIEEEFVLEFRDHLNWKYLCFVGTSITRRVVDLCVDQINWQILSRYGATVVLFTSEFLDTYSAYIDFENLPAHIFIDLDMVAKWADRLNWSNVSSVKMLFPKDFIKRFAKKFDWSIFSARNEVDEELVYDNFNLVNWIEASQNRMLLSTASDRFFHITHPYLNWAGVFATIGMEYRRKPTKFLTFVRKWIEFADWSAISKFKGGLSVGFIRQHAADLTWSQILLNYRGPALNIAFVREFCEYIHWPTFLSALSRVGSPVDALNIASEFSDRIDMNRFLMIYRNRFNQDPPEEFLDRFFDRIGPNSISRCRYTGGAFLHKHANSLDWSDVVKYNKNILDSDFMKVWGDMLVYKIQWHEIPSNVIDGWSNEIINHFSIFLKRDVE